MTMDRRKCSIRWLENLATRRTLAWCRQVMADPVSDSADTNNDGHRDIATKGRPGAAPPTPIAAATEISRPGGSGVGRPGHLGMKAPSTERDANYGVGGCFLEGRRLATGVSEGSPNSHE